MTDYALVDILKERKWKHALFTTYALSLTFFESYVLRYLHQQDCRDIYLITDADGYQMSLSERRSYMVGQEYKLIPVALPKGIFHPKCIYLSSSEGDILAVGSGNMTFGGFGRNLEVFEIFDPIENSKVFIDFSKFLESLDARKDFIAPDKSWIQLFSSFAKKAAIGTAVENSEPRLLNSVSVPIINQLENICSNHFFSQKITILSPFHDPDGIAVRNLASKLSAKKIQIALPQKQKTTFPFHKAKDWGLDISAVKPVTKHGNRTLHAKWIDIHLGDGTGLTFTGSVNATNKSLCSIDNIEVGVLRQDDMKSPWMTWEEVPIPIDIEEQKYRSSGLGKKYLIHASIRGDGVITGTVIAMSEVAGEWEGYLENSLADQIRLKIQADENGWFTHIIQADELLSLSGLQLCLFKGDKQARGWVNQEDILKLSREQRSIKRFITREETVDDEIALLNYLSLSANRHLAVFSRPISIIKDYNKAKNKNDEITIKIELADIAPDSEWPPMDNGSATQGFPGGRHVEIFAQLRRRLLGHTNWHVDKKKTIGPSDLDDDDPESLKEKETTIKPVIDKLDYFDNCIKECIDKSLNATSRRAALVIWFEVKMYMLQRYQKRDEGLGFAWEWFQKVCTSKLIVKDFGPLEQHLFTVAAVLAYKGRQLIEIHEGLERFAGGEISVDLANEFLLDNYDVGFLCFLLNGEDVLLHDIIRSIFETTTLREMLSFTLKEYESNKRINEFSPLFKSKAGNEFLHILKQKPKAQFYKNIVNSNLSICSFCFMTLSEQAKNDLKYCRIARCTSCGKFIINLQP